MVIWVLGIYLYTTIYRWVSKIWILRLSACFMVKKNGGKIFGQKVFPQKVVLSVFSVVATVIILQHSPVILWAVLSRKVDHFHRKDDLFEKLSVRQVLKMIWDLQVFFRFVWFFQGPTKKGPLACDRPQHGNRNHETCGLEMWTDGQNSVGISEPEKQKWIYQ